MIRPQTRGVDSLARPELPVSHATHLVPYVRFLDRIGSPVGCGLEQVRLPANLIAMPDCYVPTESLFGFVGHMADKEGIQDLGFRVAHDAGLRLLGPSLGAKVLRAPTLLLAIKTFCHFVGQEASNFSTSYVVGRGEVRVHVHRTFKPGTLGYTQTEWIGVVAIVSIVRLFAGPSWEPDRISLGTREHVPRIARQTFGHSRFLTAQPDVYIAFPSETLGLCKPQHAGEPRLGVPHTPPSPYRANEPAVDFAGRLMQCVVPHLADGHPGIAVAAEIAGTSVRTLQRRLSELGLSYSDVVSRARFEVASRMLTDTDAAVIEIAFATAYSDPSHFARAFRRLAGVSPREYREQAQQLGAE